MSQGSGAGAGAPPPPPASPPPAPPPVVVPLAVAPPVGSAPQDTALTGHMLEAWKKTVDVQQHFNQIEMDIRKTAVTVIVAVVGAAGFAADRGMQFVLFGWHVNVAALIVLAGLVALGAFFWMDYFQYHRLLKGAVDHGMALEKALSARGVPVDLTKKAMNPKPVEQARTRELALAFPALRCARQRAEEIAIATNTCLVEVKDGRIVQIAPDALRARAAKASPIR